MTTRTIDLPSALAKLIRKNLLVGKEKDKHGNGKSINPVRAAELRDILKKGTLEVEIPPLTYEDRGYLEITGG